jgi:hypothetical protein
MRLHFESHGCALNRGEAKELAWEAAGFTGAGMGLLTGHII